jgi:O-antigen/teichoic acid export membrane protein
VLVQLLSTDDQQAVVGAFTAALIVARIPLFLFQAVQAALLPGLSALAARGQLAEFRRGMVRLLALLLAIAVVGVAAAVAFGPWIVSHAFGSAYVVEASTTGLLALGSAAFVIATATAHANIALGGSRNVALGWLAGVVVFPIVVAVVPDLLLRVELGYVAAASTAAVAMGILLVARWRAGAQIDDGDLMEALLDLPLDL